MVKKLKRISGRRARKLLKKYDSVAELLEDRSRWTRHSEARDCYGHPVYPESESAVRFCLIGAINHVYGTSGSSISRLRAVMPSTWSIECFNDCHEHSEVLEVVRKAGI